MENFTATVLDTAQNTTAVVHRGPLAYTPSSALTTVGLSKHRLLFSKLSTKALRLLSLLRDCRNCTLVELMEVRREVHAGDAHWHLLYVDAPFIRVVWNY